MKPHQLVSEFEKALTKAGYYLPQPTTKPMKEYHVMRDGKQKTDEVVCMVQDGRNAYFLDINESLKIRSHSPAGFNFGYGGSGPAQLALAILLDYTGQAPPPAIYQAFKFKFIGPMQEPGGVITGQQIEEYLENWHDIKEGTEE